MRVAAETAPRVRAELEAAACVAAITARAELARKVAAAGVHVAAETAPRVRAQPARKAVAAESRPKPSNLPDTQACADEAEKEL